MKKKSKREKAEKRVIKAAMRLYRELCQDNTEYVPQGELFKACAALHKLPKRHEP